MYLYHIGCTGERKISVSILWDCDITMFNKILGMWRTVRWILFLEHSLCGDCYIHSLQWHLPYTIRIISSPDALNSIWCIQQMSAKAIFYMWDTKKQFTIELSELSYPNSSWWQLYPPHHFSFFLSFFFPSFSIPDVLCDPTLFEGTKTYHLRRGLLAEVFPAYRISRPLLISFLLPSWRAVRS